MNDRKQTNDGQPLGREKRQVEAALSHVREALTGLQFGEVLVVVQDGVIVQVDRTERTRVRKHERERHLSSD